VPAAEAPEGSIVKAEEKKVASMQAPALSPMKEIGSQPADETTQDVSGEMARQEDDFVNDGAQSVPKAELAQAAVADDAGEVDAETVPEPDAKKSAAAKKKGKKKRGGANN